MLEYSQQNKTAWEYNVYDFWCAHAGTPQDRAKKILADPKGQLKFLAKYFDYFEGMNIANICGSCGKKAVPLAVLGANVTIFDISEENRRYAIELADAAGTSITFVLGDVLEIDLARYAGAFDVVFMEGGVLHYFHDIRAFMDIMYALLKPGGRMICSDFHPFQKIYDALGLEQEPMDYFSTAVFSGEMAQARFYPQEVRRKMPLCSYRKYTVSEIINACLDAGFCLKCFDEYPAWNCAALPGEFVMVGQKTER